MNTAQPFSGKDFQLKQKKGGEGVTEGRRKNRKLKKQQVNGTFWHINDILLLTKKSMLYLSLHIKCF